MKCIAVVIGMFFSINLAGQDYYKIERNLIILDNGSIRREISTEGNKFCSTALLMTGMNENFIGDSREFSFSLNDKTLDGRSGWKIISSSPVSDLMQGKGVKVILEPENSSQFRVEMNYLTYPELPLIRKWISFQNTGSEELKIENLNIEDLGARINYVHAMIYHNYARMKHIGPFVGNWDDPVVVIHDPGSRRGIAIGNEVPGVLKRTAFHTKGNNLEAGLTHIDQSIPFRKWLKPGEKWESPCTFICLYQGTDNGFDVINGDVNNFIIRHMNTRIISSDEKPVFVYNTWNPFRTFVSDSLVRDVALAASECGVQEFIIDDGWQVNEGSASSDAGWGKNYGDWKVDEKKFPGGLKPTFDYIRSLGMKPGLWISIGSATPDAKVYKDHPEWFAKSADGQPGNLHEGSANKNFVTFCFGTGWVDYIRNKILSLVNDHGLAYAKLDFAVATSAYVNDDAISGCYAADHPFHKDHNESFIVIYQRLFKLFDELHKSAPDLFIDCTFETAGKLQLMDYAIARHAEGNWLSNVEQPFPAGPLRVRHLAWWRSPALPASSLVIGNLQMNEETFEFSLKSLIGSLPIVLGDPRKIPPARRTEIRKWSTWMQAMQLKYDYMSFRKDLPGFGEPAEGMWDGWMRLNTETKAGGIIGVFKQGARDNRRTVVLSDLDPAGQYTVRLAPDGKEVITTTGKLLMEKGFEVEIAGEYGANIYEVAALYSQQFVANYVESKVPEYTLPDPLIFNNGSKVKSKKQWDKRRTEIFKIFENEVYGVAPEWDGEIISSELSSDNNALNGGAVRKEIKITLKRGDKALDMIMLLYLPKSSVPVPLFLGYNFSGNHTVTSEPGISVTTSWVRNNKEANILDNKASESGRGRDASSWQVNEIISGGYGLATIYYGDVDPDYDDGFKNGVHGLYNSVPDETSWGSIAAWAWGLSRALDFLEKIPAVDSKKVVVMGHSRLGKAALWAGATDRRFAVVISNNSGCGGAALSKRIFGETVGSINRSFPHWFSNNFNKYNEKEDLLPVDQHQLLALIAPRPVYVASAEEDRWADPKGEFLSCVAASPVYKLLTGKGFPAAQMPAVNSPVVSNIGYHIRTGVHDVTLYDWQQYLEFADMHFRKK